MLGEKEYTFLLPSTSLPVRRNREPLCRAYQGLAPVRRAPQSAHIVRRGDPRPDAAHRFCVQTNREKRINKPSLIDVERGTPEGKLFEEGIKNPIESSSPLATFGSLLELSSSTSMNQLYDSVPMNRYRESLGGAEER